MNILLQNYQLNKQLTNMNNGLFFNDIHFCYFEIYFVLSIVISLIFFVWLSNKKYYNNLYLNCSNYALNILFLVIIFLLLILNSEFSIDYSIFNGYYSNDYSTVFFKNVSLFLMLLFLFAIKINITYYKKYDFEFLIILFISFFSGMLILNSNDLVTLFFIIELQSLCFYILVSSKQISAFSTESGLKYFILGCFSSSLILFGISMVYGFTGLLSYSDISLFLAGINHSMQTHFFVYAGTVFGLLFITAGLLFKLGAAPFHVWMPDVYEGAPLIVTAYLSTVPKIPLVFLFFKLYYFVFLEIFNFFQIIFVFSALLSLIVGSVAAIYQVKIKRLLTYSMITNTSYILLGLCLQNVSSIWITTFYLISYLLIMIGLFFCFLVLRNRSSGLLVKKISSLLNLVEINPALSFSLFTLLFSIAGVPPLLGFYGKFFLFMLSLKIGFYWIAIVFVIFSTISVFLLY